MTWFKVDDSFYDHPKVIALPLSARGLWLVAGTYAARHLTDGKVPLQVVMNAGRGARVSMDQLVAAGLWERTPDGIQFHDWNRYQPTKSDVEAKRDFERERKRKYRRRPNGTYSGTTTGTHTRTDSGSPSSPSRPVPTISLPTLSQPTNPEHTPPLPADAGERETPTPSQQLAATLLGIPSNDPRLNALPEILTTHNVRSPAAWIRTAATNGDLQHLLDQPTKTTTTDPWAHLQVLNPKPDNWDHHTAENPITDDHTRSTP